MTTFTKTNPNVIFPVSANPLHAQHLEIANWYEKKYGGTVKFEIARDNADKGTISDEELQRRLNQFDRLGRLAYTSNKATFVQKALSNNNTVFLVGADTIRRVGQVKYYFDSVAEMIRCLELIEECGCTFMVFDRLKGGKLLTLDNVVIPDHLRKLCTRATDYIPSNISSSDIRNKNNNRICAGLLNVNDKFTHDKHIDSLKVIDTMSSSFIISTNGIEFYQIDRNDLVTKVNQ